MGIQSINFATMKAAAAGGGAMPTVASIGTFSASVSDLEAPLPVGYQENDILLLFVETQAFLNVSAPTGGWAAVDDSPQESSNVTKLHVFWKRATSSESNPTVVNSTDHTIGVMLAIRGCVTSGSPFDDTAGDNLGVDSSTVIIPGVTTTTANCLIIGACSIAQNSTTSNVFFSGWTNSNLSDVTEVLDETSTFGSGGGFGVVSGGAASTGATGNTTASLAAPKFQGRWCGALKP